MPSQMVPLITGGKLPCRALFPQFRGAGTHLPTWRDTIATEQFSIEQKIELTFHMHGNGSPALLVAMDGLDGNTNKLSHLFLCLFQLFSECAELLVMHGFHPMFGQKIRSALLCHIVVRMSMFFKAKKTETRLGVKSTLVSTDNKKVLPPVTGGHLTSSSRQAVGKLSFSGKLVNLYSAHLIGKVQDAKEQRNHHGRR
jgi:hypothetical protein